jgi:hypothetical protein
MIRQNSEGQITFHAIEDSNEVISALDEVIQTTPIGRQYVSDDCVAADGSDGFKQIVEAAMQIAGGPTITAGNIAHALTLLIDSGELRPKKAKQSKQLAEPEVDTTPRDKNGKALTESQLKWSSFRQFAEQASMAEINRRKASDPEFANFVRKNLEREMSQEVGDAVTPAGSPTANKRANQDLVDFVRKYHAEPSQNLRPRGGFVHLDGQQLPYSQFIELVNAATNARLL